MHDSDLGARLKTWRGEDYAKAADAPVFTADAPVFTADAPVFTVAVQLSARQFRL
jgi:hypothetical protein